MGIITAASQHRGYKDHDRWNEDRQKDLKRLKSKIFSEQADKAVPDL